MRPVQVVDKAVEALDIGQLVRTPRQQAAAQGHERMARRTQRRTQTHIHPDRLVQPNAVQVQINAVRELDAGEFTGGVHWRAGSFLV